MVTGSGGEYVKRLVQCTQDIPKSKRLLSASGRYAELEKTRRLALD
jgi:hypothetical protein